MLRIGICDDEDVILDILEKIVRLSWQPAGSIGLRKRSLLRHFVLYYLYANTKEKQEQLRLKMVVAQNNYRVTC